MHVMSLDDANAKAGGIEVAKLRLKQTRDWCALHANALDPLGSLRAPEIDACTGDRRELGFTYVEDGEYQEMVDCIASRRAELLQHLVSQGQMRPIDSIKGRLLLYFPKLSQAFGLTEHMSGGFFDGADAPPCDTWVWYKVRSRPMASFLLSWVPQPFLLSVDEAITAEPTDCIYWADISGISLADILGQEPEE
jgi:hypothetical protein